MTRKSKRELEREVNDLSDDEDAGEGILIAAEQDAGTLTDLDGDPYDEDTVENAGLVIVY
jgi:hypothetical protein